RATVVVDTLAPCARRGGRKETATAQTRHSQAGVTDQARAGHRPAGFGDFVPPRADPWNAGVEAPVHRFAQRPTLRGGRVEAQPRKVGWPEDVSQCQPAPGSGASWPALAP